MRGVDAGWERGGWERIGRTRGVFALASFLPAQE